MNIKTHLRFSGIMCTIYNLKRLDCYQEMDHYESKRSDLQNLGKDQINKN